VPREKSGSRADGFSSAGEGYWEGIYGTHKTVYAREVPREKSGSGADGFSSAVERYLGGHIRNSK
jgi:hypothetical protein